MHAGYYKLIWSSPFDKSSTLEESNDSLFENPGIFKINNNDSITLTGRENGTYYYRLRDSNNELSNVVHVTVEHHSVEKAFAFFALGLCIFIILVFVLRSGHLSIKTEVK